MSAATTAAPPSVVRSSSRRQQQQQQQQQPSYNNTGAERHHHRTSSSSRQSTSQPPEPRRSTSNPPGHNRGHSMSQQPSSSSSSQQQQQQQQNLSAVARRDYEQTNVARPQPTTSSGTRRSSSRDGSYATAPSHRSDGSRGTPHRSDSRHGQPRYSSDVNRNPSSAHAPPPNMRARPEGSSVQPGLHDTQNQQVRRRTTVTAPTGVWALGKTIGAGSMGKVKLARNMETGEQVAIKIVPRGSTDEHRNEKDRERADHSKEIRTAREASIVTLLKHPFISGMKDVVRTNNHWYMLFEYINGGQMLDYIISHGRLKEKNARKFARQIASALDYCHKNSIVHRDLKIENILISKTGDIKIIDFGLSNLFAPKTQLKTFCGSLYFAAPELLQARQYTGPEVDVWSFGIVLYVLVCGKVPFDDQSMPQLHEKIKKGQVDYPSWLSPDCKGLIARMLVKDPRQRASLQEVMTHPWMTKGFPGPPESYLPLREPLTLPLDDSVIEKMGGFDFGPPELIRDQLTQIVQSEDYQAAVRSTNRDAVATTPGTEKKRGVFDFYKRRNSTTSRDTLPNLSAEAVHVGNDPIHAFHPLISVYYLAREKQEREKQESNPGALVMPQSPGEKPIEVPDLPAPQAAYTNSSSYEMPGEKPSGGRSRPRARTHGEDDLADPAKKVQNEQSSSHAIPQVQQQPAAKKESMAGGLLRRFSTRRGKDHVRAESQALPSVSLHPPSDQPSTLRRGLSLRKSRRDASNSPMIHSAGSQPQQTAARHLLTPPLNASGNMVSRAGSKLLGSSTSVNSAEWRRKQQTPQGTDGALSPALGEPPATSGSDRSSINTPKVKINEPSTSSDNKPNSTTRNQSSRKSLGHARHESIQARRARRGESKQNNVLEETDEETGAAESADGTEGQNDIKHVYLKGLFSVSTTSNKPLPAIRAEITRVLRQLGVDYTEIKGGYHCRHAPSIDLNKVIDIPSSQVEHQSYTPNHRRRISFVGFMGGDKEKDNDPERTPRTPSRRRQGPDNSFTNSEDSEEDRTQQRKGPLEKTAGETSTHVQSDMGENMILRFEIFIVKVPLFSLHGIQFKKVAGGTWQYKNMAQKILDAMRL